MSFSSTDKDGHLTFEEMQKMLNGFFDEIGFKDAEVNDDVSVLSKILFEHIDSNRNGTIEYKGSIGSNKSLLIWWNNEIIEWVKFLWQDETVIMGGNFESIQKVVKQYLLDTLGMTTVALRFGIHPVHHALCYCFMF